MGGWDCVVPPHAEAVRQNRTTTRRFVRLGNLQRIHILGASSHTVPAQLLLIAFGGEAFLPLLDGLVTEGLVTVEPAQIILYRAPEQPRR